MLGLPIFDTCFAIFRRWPRGRAPWPPDRGHIHHRLIDMGFSQKQAVAVLYVISAILGLSAVVLTTTNALKAMLFLLALCAAGGGAKLFWHTGQRRKNGPPEPRPGEPGGHSTAPPRRMAGNDNFFGEEDRSDK